MSVKEYDDLSHKSISRKVIYQVPQLICLENNPRTYYPVFTTLYRPHLGTFSDFSLELDWVQTERSVVLLKPLSLQH